jgi:hypothetical protein
MLSIKIFNFISSSLHFPASPSHIFLEGVAAANTVDFKVAITMHNI